MEALLLFLPFLVPVIVAQFAEKQRWAQVATYVLLIATNVALLGLAGLVGMLALASFFGPGLVEAGAWEINWIAVTAACLLTGLLAFVPLLPVVRRWIARWLSIDPESMVHATALVYAVYWIGLSLGQMALIGDLENLAQVEMALTVWDVLLNGIPLLLFAVIGVGWIIRRGGRATMERLGIFKPTWKQLLVAVVVTALLLGVDMAVNLAWQELGPTSFEVWERVAEHMFGNLATVTGALVLGLSAGISEELLFRGAVQPRLGLLLTTFMFALAHMQYGLTIATLEVFLIGLALGLMRNWSNTTICVLIHAGYNTVGMFLGMLQS
jgi:membrane protease YdiL (CAAX protease family)